MNFEYKLNEQDLIDFNLFHVTYSKMAKRMYFLQRYIISLSFLIFPFLLKQFTDIPFGYSLVLCILLYMYWVTFYPKRLKRIISKKISKMVAEGKNNSVVGTHNLVISETGIFDKSEHSEARTEFGAIENVVEDKGHIFVYVSSNSAHIIPLRVFESDSQRYEFLTLLKTKSSRVNSLS